MRFVSKVFSSLVSSVVSVIVSLFGLVLVYDFYSKAWERFGLSSCERTFNASIQPPPPSPPQEQIFHITYRCLSGLESNVFRGMYFCLMLFAFAGTMAFSIWLAKRLGAWVPVTAICTVTLVALAVFPILVVTTGANCQLIENFPLPGNWCD
jgi:hypothetical protein